VDAMLVQLFRVRIVLMRLRFVLPALALAVVAASAKAQKIGVYLNPVVTRVHISQTDTGPFAFLGENTTTRFFGGVDIGGYYNFAHQPGFDVGADVRDTIVHSNNASLNTFMVALKLQGHPWKLGVKPYVQLGIGAGTTKAEVSLVHTTKAEYGIFGGLDHPLNRHVDFRVIELGYGSVTTTSSAIYGGPTPIPAASLIHISSGLVFTFGQR
jgi:hypothetical protein